MADEVPAELRETWERAVARWEDVALHETLLGLVVRHNCFAWAAARYRERAGDPIADKQLDRVRLTATAALMGATARRTADKGVKPYRSSIVALGIILVMIALGLVFAKVIQQTRPAPVTQGVLH